MLARRRKPKKSNSNKFKMKREENTSKQKVEDQGDEDGQKTVTAHTTYSETHHSAIDLDASRSSVEDEINLEHTMIPVSSHAYTEESFRSSETNKDHKNRFDYESVQQQLPVVNGKIPHQSPRKVKGQKFCLESTATEEVRGKAPVNTIVSCSDYDDYSDDHNGNAVDSDGLSRGESKNGFDSPPATGKTREIVLGRGIGPDWNRSLHHENDDASSEDDGGYAVEPIELCTKTQNGVDCHTISTGREIVPYSKRFLSCKRNDDDNHDNDNNDDDGDHIAVNSEIFSIGNENGFDSQLIEKVQCGNIVPYSKTLKHCEMSDEDDNDVDNNVEEICRSVYGQNLTEHKETKCCNCGKRNDRIRKCGACKKAIYCDKNCQREHWGKHKPKCVRYRRFNDKLNGNGMLRVQLSFRVQLTKISTLEDVRTEDRFDEFVRLVFGIDSLKCIVLEVVSKYFHPCRPACVVQDVNGKQTHIVFHTAKLTVLPNGFGLPMPLHEVLTPGTFICIIDPTWYYFEDGTLGIKIDDPRLFEFL